MDSHIAPRNPAGPAATAPVAGGFVTLDGEAYYRIEAYHRLEPFLMSLASDTDLWMFVTSGGGLTAGRVDADGAFLPYVTSDKLHDAHHHCGPITLVRVAGHDGASVLWQPFDPLLTDESTVTRHLYKNTVGNRLVFEEINHDLGLSFRYRWASCDMFGWVRTATLTATGETTARVVVLDGLRDVLPHGAPLRLYQQSSNLIDAYKKNEIDPDTGLGIFSLTAGITDRAEALESLRANVVWHVGTPAARMHLSDAVVGAFRQKRPYHGPRTVNGRRGHYFAEFEAELAPHQPFTWHLVADSGCDHARIAALRARLRQGDDLPSVIAAHLDEATENLRRIIGSHDGLQMSGRPEAWVHHLANVLFNGMRGGVFARNHDVDTADVREFIAIRNREVAQRCAATLDSWPETMTADQLRENALATGDAGLARLAHEYLPLYFGRRHGDPSRPWNRFAIRVRDRHGERLLNHEGNWRDIFQNWEALATSFPEFLPSMVAVFVNASTVDGFNPYRLTRDGIDWEVPDPEDPWSNIGYWGDHQIIYLLKLLEAWHANEPAALNEMLGRDIFSYADVPYRIRAYAEIVRDASNTIIFDEKRQALTEKRSARLGSDGKLLAGVDGKVVHVNLLEKLLVPALAKLSNLIPDAGIWMNTQRPEWNDANNALAGGGVSVVTMAYLRRYLAFLVSALAPHADAELPVSAEVADWLDHIQAILDRERGLLAGDRLDRGDRKHLLDALGRAFTAYRDSVYAHGFSGRRPVSVGRALNLCRTALAYLDWGLAASRREDGLYHSYNLLSFSDGDSRAVVGRLQEMLEGQVAVLSSGVLSAPQALDLLRRLFDSALYKKSVKSFLLYPEHDRPGFLTKNQVPADRAARIDLVQRMLESGDSRLVARDVDGVLRFHGDLGQDADVVAVLDDLARDPAWKKAVAQDRDAVLELFEGVFQHQAYTGRSGVMFGYEGLGCIYWHMVAKLLVAVQEVALAAERDGQPREICDALAQMYYRVRAGIGYEKTVAEYGAFPTDPYSHSSPDGNAKQPGMTGQVKEEILTRWGELGVRVAGGRVTFDPTLLQADEYLSEITPWVTYDLEGEVRTIELPAGSLGFTLCQVPVVYRRDDDAPELTVTLVDGSVHTNSTRELDPSLSADLLGRGGRIHQIVVGIPAAR